MSLQMTGNQEGVSSLRANVTHIGGVPLEALQKSIVPAWRSLQQQHSKLEALAEVRRIYASAFIQCTQTCKLRVCLRCLTTWLLDTLFLLVYQLCLFTEEVEKAGRGIEIFCPWKSLTEDIP